MQIWRDTPLPTCASCRSRTPASARMCRRQVPAICCHDVSPLWRPYPRFTHGTRRAFGQSSAWLFGRLHRPQQRHRHIVPRRAGHAITPMDRRAAQIQPGNRAAAVGVAEHRACAEQLVEAQAPVFEPLAITLTPSSRPIRRRHLAGRRTSRRTPSKGKDLRPPRTRRAGKQLWADICLRMETDAFGGRNRRQVRITRE